MFQPNPQIYDKSFFTVYYPNNGPIADMIIAREERAVRFLGPLQGKKILDLGCGNGSLALKIGLKGAKCIGIDYSKDAVKIAKNNLLRLKSNIGNRVEFRVMNAVKLDFADQEFDGVVSLDVIEHIPPETLKEVFKEINRVTKKRGCIVIRTAPNAFFEAPLHFIAKIILHRKHLETEKYHINLQNYFSLKEYLKFIGGNSKVLILNDGRNHFSSKLAGMKNIPGWVKIAGQLVDIILDSRIGTKFATETYLRIFLGRDIWSTTVKN